MLSTHTQQSSQHAIDIPKHQQQAAKNTSPETSKLMHIGEAKTHTLERSPSTDSDSSRDATQLLSTAPETPQWTETPEEYALAHRVPMTDLDHHSHTPALIALAGSTLTYGPDLDEYGAGLDAGVAATKQTESMGKALKGRDKLDYYSEKDAKAGEFDQFKGAESATDKANEVATSSMTKAGNIDNSPLKTDPLPLESKLDDYHAEQIQNAMASYDSSTRPTDIETTQPDIESTKTDSGAKNISDVASGLTIAVGGAGLLHTAYEGYELLHLKHHQFHEMAHMASHDIDIGQDKKQPITHLLNKRASILHQLNKAKNVIASETFIRMRLQDNSEKLADAGLKVADLNKFDGLMKGLLKRVSLYVKSAQQSAALAPLEVRAQAKSNKLPALDTHSPRAANLNKLENQIRANQEGLQETAYEIKENERKLVLQGINAKDLMQFNKQG